MSLDPAIDRALGGVRLEPASAPACGATPVAPHAPEPTGVAPGRGRSSTPAGGAALSVTATFRRGVALTAIGGLTLVLALLPDSAERIASYAHFFLLGITGAIVANSTGTGGGVVFIPFFDLIRISPASALATSVLIQCFGMTIGGLSWLLVARAESTAPRWRHLPSVLGVAVPPAALGMVVGLISTPPGAPALRLVFELFSIAVGLAIFVVTLRTASSHAEPSVLTRADRCMIALVALVGGGVTALISVGVGELLALVLIFRRHSPLVAVAAGVCVSSTTCLAGAPLLIAGGQAELGVLLFAAPAAMIGGSIAHALAAWLGPRRLKLFFSGWVMASGVAMWALAR